MNNKIKRNDPCPCGSGKKYKKCCAASNTIDSEAQFNSALQAIQKGQFNHAITLLQSIVSREPQHADAHHYLGLALLQTGNQNQGTKSIKHSIKIQPHDPTFLSNYGLILLEQGNIAEAESFFRQALSLDSSHILSKYNLAILLERTLRYTEARVLLETLLKNHPNDFDLIALYARVLAGLEQWSNAIAMFEKALKIKPEDISVNTEYCNLLRITNNPEKAIHRYEMLLKSNPDNSKLILNYANFCEAENHLDKTEQYLEQAGKLQNTDLDRLLYEKGRLYRRKKEYSSSIHYLEQVNINNLGHHLKTSYFFELAKSYDKANRYNDAFSAFEKANNQTSVFFNHKQDIKQENERYNKINNVLNQTNLKEWSKLSPAASKNGPEPVFIVGFTRSGSTLVEQILSSHKNIRAGGEYTFIYDIQQNISDILNSDKEYPDALLAIKGPQELAELRTAYKSLLDNAIDNKSNQYWITDKRLLNSMELNLIYLLFPQSPVLHIVRHPLDVCLSTYFSNLPLHPYSNDLLATAHKFVQVINQIEYVKKITNIKIKTIKYEKLVESPEDNIRSLIEFIGEPWDNACLNFHKNKRVAKTESYAQVNQPLYKSSLNRYKNYKDPIKDIIPILEPVIYELGYTI